jgi:hypothetical protein
MRVGNALPLSMLVDGCFGFFSGAGSAGSARVLCLLLCDGWATMSNVLPLPALLPEAEEALCPVLAAAEAASSLLFFFSSFFRRLAFSHSVSFFGFAESLGMVGKMQSQPWED